MRKNPPRSHRLSSSGDAVTGISQQRKIEPKKLHQILRGDLDWIVMKAIEKDRSRRYETANGLGADITRYLTGDVVQARPPSTAYRLRKYVSKNKGLVVSLAAIATLLLAGIIGTSWFGFEANVARKKADLKTAEVTNEKAKVELEKQNVERERDRANQNEGLAKVEAGKARKAEQKSQAALEQTEATLARSNYFLAVARWNENRAAEANDFLDRVPLEHRQFEWYLARRQFAGSYMTCFGHTGPVLSVSFSPDGARIVSGSDDNTIKVWDASSGAELRTLKGHTSYVSSVSFSPDSVRIYSQAGNGEQFVWDAETGKRLESEQWQDVDSQKLVSAAGRWLVASSGDHVLMVDLEFKNRPGEAALRASKAKLDSYWHRERAELAETASDWYAATFHRAWVMKADPDQAIAFDRLHRTLEELTLEYAAQNKELTPYLHPVVVEMLKLPRGQESSKVSDFQPEQINNDIWNKVKSPPQETTAAVLSDAELNRFRETVAQQPKGIYFNTLAAAEFRMGNYEESIKAANKSMELTPKELNLPGPHPIDLAIIAMSQFKLGIISGANRYRAKFNDAIKLDRFKDDEECHSFANEINELFGADGSKINEK